MAQRIPFLVAQALIDQNLVPANCLNVEILMPANGVMVFRYEVYVMPEDFPKLATAFAAMAEQTPVPVSDWHGDLMPT